MILDYIDFWFLLGNFEIWKLIVSKIWKSKIINVQTTFKIVKIWDLDGAAETTSASQQITLILIQNLTEDMLK